jgi:hypothetical protein
MIQLPPTAFRFLQEQPPATRRVYDTPQAVVRSRRFRLPAIRLPRLRLARDHAHDLPVRDCLARSD